MNWSLPGSSIKEIFQATIVEWVAVPFSRGSSHPMDRTQISCIAVRFFTVWATREAPQISYISIWKNNLHFTFYRKEFINFLALIEHLIISGVLGKFG